MRAISFQKKIIPAAILLVIAVSACRHKTIVLKSPPNYNFSNAVTYKLDIAKLREVSGLVWDSVNKVFLAIADEAGKIYSMDKDARLLPDEINFGASGDYEDIAIFNGVSYVLRSDGMITKIVKDSTGKISGTEAGKIDPEGSNDFETMYCDPARNALVVICKNCSSDDKKSVTAFAFYPDSIGFDKKPLYTIDAEKINKLSPSKSAKLQPSAAAINPKLQKLFIISSASHQLVIADLNGNPESVFRLSPKLFPQPEGITFNPKGDMFITNEGLNSKATLLKFYFTNKTDSLSKKDSGAAYNFSVPDEKIELGKHLHEISGMAYIPGKDLILGENDEKGDIFTIDYKNKNDNVNKVKFGGKGDYEDIVYTDTAIYMLISTGTIVQVQTKDSTFATNEFTLPGDKNEFETMYLGADKKSLILLCKECAHEKKTDIRTAYRFDLTTNSFDPAPAYTIDVNSIKTMLNDPEALFKPSAAAINPEDGKLYIVASVGKLLVVADKNTGKPEHVYRPLHQMVIYIFLMKAEKG
jgi:uncharacterized protein YjiK